MPLEWHVGLFAGRLEQNLVVCVIVDVENQKRLAQPHWNLE
jgi:hypothetical protein